MKKLVFLTLFSFAFIGVFAQINDILGDWITVDDATGDSFSVVHIYKGTNGKYYGKISQMLIAGTENEKCVACEGQDKDKPILGMVIIRDMQEKDGALVGGRVLDPNNGKFYYGKISLDKGRLKLRGSLDKAGLLGRSQYWKRK